MDVDSYLERVGCDGPREPSARTLAALQRAHEDEVVIVVEGTEVRGA